MKEKNDIPTRSQLKSSSVRQSLALKVGASLLVLITLGTLTYFLLREKNFSPPISIFTSGSVRRILLPDSSGVVISRNSELTYPKSYKGNRREVYLSGEAFFKVVGNKEKPFIVHTDRADIRVVGTAFNVQAGTDHFEVGVSEGTVLVTNGADSLYIEAGHTVVLAPGDKDFIRKTNTDINAWSYATRKFVFKNTSLSEVLANIEKASPYTFRISDQAIGNCTLTATFEDVPTEDMIGLIAESLDLTVIQDEYVFVLQGKGCP